tara:strand:- start:528 stop:731 length:204 start_codon:yes stop_codon:yes gene_type:complete
MTELYKNNLDILVFNCLTTLEQVFIGIKGGVQTLCKYGIEFEYGYINEKKTEWRGKPAHNGVEFINC